VIFFRDQNLSEDDQVAFGRRFGGRLFSLPRRVTIGGDKPYFTRYFTPALNPS